MIITILLLPLGHISFSVTMVTKHPLCTAISVAFYKVIITKNYTFGKVPLDIFNFTSTLFYFIFTIDWYLWVNKWSKHMITWELLFSCRFQQNSLVLPDNWILSNHPCRALHVASLGTMKSRLNITFGDHDMKIVAIVFLWWHIMLYKAR
jgi:hypothetical protein